MIIVSDKVKLYCDIGDGVKYKVLSINEDTKIIRVEDKAEDNPAGFRRFSMDRKCGCTTKVYIEIED